MPLYEDGELANAIGVGGGATLVWETPDSVQKAFRSYSDCLEGAGLSASKQELALHDESQVRTSKFEKDGMIETVAVVKSGEGAVVSVTAEAKS